MQLCLCGWCPCINLLDTEAAALALAPEHCLLLLPLLLLLAPTAHNRLSLPLSLPPPNQPPHTTTSVSSRMQTSLQLGRSSSAAGCSLQRQNAQRRVVVAARSSNAIRSRQPLLVHNKFSNPFDGMFGGGGKGGDSDAARRAIEVRGGGR